MMESLKTKIEIVEKKAIIKALDDCGWVQAKAAKYLGITERMIGYKMKKYKISKGGRKE
jgi:Nif-specific regulatory protein